jgi:hypothetical protein
MFGAMNWVLVTVAVYERSQRWSGGQSALQAGRRESSLIQRVYMDSHMRHVAVVTMVVLTQLNASLVEVCLETLVRVFLGGKVVTAQLYSLLWTNLERLKG